VSSATCSDTDGTTKAIGVGRADCSPSEKGVGKHFAVA